MHLKDYCADIRKHIASGQLPEALRLLQALLTNSPRLDEAILQSGRYHLIQEYVRKGMVSFTEANKAENEVRASLLELLTEIEIQGELPALREEVERAISVMNSKNVVIGSNITAGGNVHI